jgi:hypothetical protein
MYDAFDKISRNLPSRERITCGEKSSRDSGASENKMGANKGKHNSEK